jgi:hypothetical protein
LLLFLGEPLLKSLKQLSFTQKNQLWVVPYFLMNAAVRYTARTANLLPWTCNKHSLAGAVSQRAFVFCGSRAVLISGVGEPPYEILSKSGVKPVEASGFIEEGLKVIYQHRKTALLRGRRNPCSDETCSGSGSGRS